MDLLVNALLGRGYFAAGLHGDMKQEQRDRVMQGFRTGKTEILVATDVAARGIDVDEVEAVFNYDLRRMMNIMYTVSGVPDAQDAKEEHFLSYQEKKFTN